MGSPDVVSLREGLGTSDGPTVSFRIACDVLFDCGAHHITTMKGQVLVNRAISHFRKVIPAVVQREGRASGY